MNQQPNIQLIPGNYYMFNYQGQPKNLSFRVQDQEGLHFDEPDEDEDINWDFIIPTEDIASVNFQPSMDGYTTTESFSDVDTDDEMEGGKKRKRKTLKKYNKKSKKCKGRKCKKTKRMKKSKKTRKNKH